jgi:hypothetical protein
VQKQKGGDFSPPKNVYWARLRSTSIIAPREGFVRNKKGGDSIAARNIDAFRTRPRSTIRISRSQALSISALKANAGEWETRTPGAAKQLAVHAKFRRHLHTDKQRIMFRCNAPWHCVPGAFGEGGK